MFAQLWWQYQPQHRDRLNLIGDPMLRYPSFSTTILRTVVCGCIRASSHTHRTSTPAASNFSAKAGPSTLASAASRISVSAARLTTRSALSAKRGSSIISQHQAPCKNGQKLIANADKNIISRGGKFVMGRIFGCELPLLPGLSVRK